MAPLVALRELAADRWSAAAPRIIPVASKAVGHRCLWKLEPRFPHRDDSPLAIYESAGYPSGTMLAECLWPGIDPTWDRCSVRPR
jgi:hypothetical protein